jgi:hypothetical protein
MKRFLAVVGILLFGCEKKIDFTLHDQPDKLVVEATIENDQPPMVILSKSVGYFSKISPAILNLSFVHGAEVFVSNGTVTHKLKEYPRALGNGITFYYYSIDSSNLSTSFTGQLNHQYSLRIVSEGKEYTATTTIPNLNKRIDSLWWKKPPVITSDSSKVIVMFRATDPPGFGDYIRYYTKTNHEPFYPPLSSTFDDFFIDGTTYELQLDKGVDRNLDIDFEKNYFKRGDTIGVKLSSIDKATYDFWRTMEYSYSSVGDPFSTPTKVLTNIKGDALGYFGGYASQYRSIIIPH